MLYRPEVLASLGAHVCPQLHDNLARILPVYGDVPEHTRVLHRDLLARKALSN